MEPTSLHTSEPSSCEHPPAKAAWLEDPDVTLMKRVRAGDIESFTTLFRKHSGAVIQYAYRFVQSRSRAEELAQTVFLHLYKARDRYEPRARFLTYLYRIATNVCLNELRRQKHGMVMDSLDAPIDGDPTSMQSPPQIADEKAEDPVAQLSGKELEHAVRRILDQLPAQQRAAFLLGRFEGLSYREVAEALGTSVSAVKSLIFRATRAIRNELQDSLQEAECPRFSGRRDGSPLSSPDTSPLHFHS